MLIKSENWSGRRDLNPRPERAPGLAAQSLPLGASNCGTLRGVLKDLRRLLWMGDKREKYVGVAFNQKV